MRFRYSQFDSAIRHNMSMEKIMKIFLQLLMHTHGDVEEALDWLERLWRQYSFFGGEKTIEDFKEYLREQGVVRATATGFQLTAKGEQRIRTAAFEEIFSSLRHDLFGGHRTPNSGSGGERLAETRAFAPGDNVRDIHYPRSFHNALVRTHGSLDDMREDDLEIHEVEQHVSSATALLLDISHSMILYGEDRFTPAKTVAMALTELIQTRYPKDSLDVVLFGDDAQRVPTQRLPYVHVGPFHTNTKAGLEMGQKILRARKQSNKQIIMITDGKPSAIWEGQRLYKNPFGLDPKIVNQTINEAVACRRRGIVITTFMITTDPHLQDFVDRLTRANRGRAFYASLDRLGSFILADYVRNRKKKV